MFKKVNQVHLSTGEITPIYLNFNKIDSVENGQVYTNRNGLKIKYGSKADTFSGNMYYLVETPDEIFSNPTPLITDEDFKQLDLFKK